MIAYILKSPDLTKMLGFITGPDATVNGVACLGGYLEDVGEWSNRINISKAQGAVPEPVEYSFSLIDWTGITRRSLGILDGSSQLIGWSVEAWAGTDLAGLQYVQLDAEIVSAEAGDDSVAISVRERWVGVGTTVGVGTGTNRVGLAVGAMEITVKVPEISEPVAIDRLDVAGDGTWKIGIPGASSDARVTATKATSKSAGLGGYTYLYFRVSGFTEMTRLREYINSIGADVIAIGAKSACKIGSVSGNYAFSTISPSFVYSVYVIVNQDFYDSENPKDCFLSIRSANTPIVYGASSLIGFVDKVNRIVSPFAEVAVSNYTLSFTPELIAPDGFLSYSLLPCSIAWTDTATTPDANHKYSGNVYNIPTDGTVAALGDYDSFLQPTGTQPALTIWLWCNLPGAYPGTKDSDETKIPLRVNVVDEVANGYSGFFIDVAGSFAAYTVDYNAQVKLCYSWVTPDALFTITPGTTWTGGLSLRGIDANRKSQRFDSMDALNASAFSYLSALLQRNGFDPIQAYANLQLQAVNLYGISTLSYGSSYAVVMPGQSIWQSATASDNTPRRTAYNLLEANGIGLNPDPYPLITQSYNVPAGKWSMAFDAETTILDAAKAICAEHWITVGTGSDEGSSGFQIMEPPSFTLGDRLDVVTEPVVEFDYWAGEYRRKAYISHVDEAYDSSKPDYYFGGWDSDDSPEGYGLSLWNMCRKAYQIHGVRRTETFSFQSIRAPDEMGKMWLSSRNGVARMRWLALQSRYITTKSIISNPYAWAGNASQFSADSASLAGYDLSAYNGTPLLITERRWDPMTLIASTEFALPPVPSVSGNRITQTLDAGANRYIQTLSATDRIIQVQET